MFQAGLKTRPGNPFGRGVIQPISRAMNVPTAQLLVDAIAAYLGIGAIFATAFLSLWLGRVDPLAARGTRGFRVLIFPGVTALWPMFAVRLMRGASKP
jgi:hypothetical protein